MRYSGTVNLSGGRTNVVVRRYCTVRYMRRQQVAHSRSDVDVVVVVVA